MALGLFEGIASSFTREICQHDRRRASCLNGRTMWYHFKVRSFILNDHWRFFFWVLSLRSSPSQHVLGNSCVHARHELKPVLGVFWLGDEIIEPLVFHHDAADASRQEFLLARAPEDGQGEVQGVECARIRVSSICFIRCRG